MKKVLLVFLSIFVLFNAYSVSIRYSSPENSFDSIPMLDAHFSKEKVEFSKEESDFWNSVKVSLIVEGKNDPLYSWFGHAAIMFSSDGIEPVMFDYGRFSFDDSFYLNFAMGRLWYKCSATWARYELEQCKEQNRKVSALELNLTSEEKVRIYEFLYLNSSPEYDTYLYHNYKDNCSTRLRDIIDYATGGELKAWAETIPGYTYRQQISRILGHAPLVMWTLNLLQGPSIDESATLWDEMFLPEILENALVEYSKLGNQVELLVNPAPSELKDESFDYPQSFKLACIICGLLFTIVLLLTECNFKVIYKVISCAFLFLFGLVGVLMVFMSGFTMHDYCWFNENLIFVNPLLIIAGIGVLKNNGKTTIRILTGLLILLCISKLLFPLVFIQQNIEQILFILPIYIGFSLPEKWLCHRKK